ncbi:hypothetical protein [Nonomuraea angiospora]|uniref:hypothetical protein n=1 Tax=Nonomuraea angiospora TaxID=46172 RepID=UPI0029A9858B|nr:hypothetical protein [Nonomuraea angiospora]MDX3101778.1 hypothetical protein [Nonomuraea angiospora]
MTEIIRADWGEWDWETITESFYPVMAEIQDIHHHRMAGTEWTPWAERGDVTALIDECRGILEKLEKPIKEARAAIANIERTARLRAIRRERAGA